jgi:N-acetylmuramoyl-L-alanine amidase
MDGGGSVQGLFPGGEVSSDRMVATVILLWEDTGTTPAKDPEEETPMLKIALGAGHGINTEGKRCMKALDPNETREWWLNDRICDYVESYLKDYEGYKLLRLDDSDDGKVNVPLADRVKAANDFGADFYLSVHHNAGINGGSGGGIVAYVHPSASASSKSWQSILYDALIKHTGLKGNRSQPKATGDYYVLKHTKMPAVLLELGFMDSKTDVPIILTNEYAQQCARAIVEVIVERGKLTKKAEPETGVLYKVQVGAFSKKENADKLLTELKAKGYQGYIIRT